MAVDVTRVDVWAAGTEDRPGGLAEKLCALAEAGVELQFVMARRAPDKPGKGVVFVTPVKGAAQARVARKAGFHKTKSLHSVRVQGADKAGMGAKITQTLAEKGINLRGLSAGVIGKRFSVYLALDSAVDAAKTVRALKAMR